MSLLEKVNNDMKTALKQKNQAQLRGLRAIKSAIMMMQTDAKGKKELTEADELQLLQKMVKQRKESEEIYIQQDRLDLAEKEGEERKVITQYLPQQMGEEDLQEEIQQIIKEMNATSVKDMGKVMGVASKKLAGKADNKAIADMTKSILQNK